MEFNRKFTGVPFSSSFSCFLQPPTFPTQSCDTCRFSSTKCLPSKLPWVHCNIFERAASSNLQLFPVPLKCIYYSFQFSPPPFACMNFRFSPHYTSDCNKNFPYCPQCEYKIKIIVQQLHNPSSKISISIKNTVVWNAQNSFSLCMMTISEQRNFAVILGVESLVVFLHFVREEKG